MKGLLILVAGLAGLITVFSTPAVAVTIDYASSAGSSIDFDPADGCGGGSVGCFSFSSGNNIVITSGTATSFAGGINGLFGIGTITDTNTPVGNVETAPVSGSGTLSIFDGSTVLTADLTWVDLATFGTAGSLNTNGTANLSNIQYTGSNGDLVALASAGAGMQTATFQFATPTSLTEIFTNRTTQTSTSFSGSIAPSAIPAPAAFWLFGSGLIGLAGVARRRIDGRFT